MIKIEVDDRAIIDLLGQIQRKMSDLSAPLSDIGEHLSETTKRRFDSSTGPDGKRWLPNSQVTILQSLGVYSGSFRKDGRISSKGAGRAMSKRPLIGETKSLMSQIHYQLIGHDAVEIGSPMEYAAVQQFGASKGQFGRDKRNHPIPWGNIPARPFLGVSDDDQRSILEILHDYLTP